MGDTGSFRDWWRSNYEIIKSESFDNRPTELTVYEHYCHDTGNSCSLKNFKIKTMQLGMGICLTKKRRKNGVRYYNVIKLHDG